ncbi:squalene epoxidase, partial [Tanacetum coccineum]
LMALLNLSSSYLMIRVVERNLTKRVVERELTERDRIVSDMLQPDSYLMTPIELGLEATKKNNSVEDIDAHRVFGYALVKDGRNTRSTLLSFGEVSFSSGRINRRLFTGVSYSRSVAFCHAHSVLQRDLKLHNLLLDRKTLMVKIRGLGLARVEVLDFAEKLLLRDANVAYGGVDDMKI